MDEHFIYAKIYDTYGKCYSQRMWEVIVNEVELQMDLRIGRI